MKMRNIIFNALCKRPPIVYPLVDLDGNEYSTVVIGSQEWIVENFKSAKYADGSEISLIEDIDPWFLPSKDELNKIWVNLCSGLDENGVTYTPVGSFGADIYWSSSELGTNCYNQYMVNGNVGTASKVTLYRVRAITSFGGTLEDYPLRSMGPSGGIIFAFYNGFVYEAAAFDQSFNQRWSNISTSIGTTGTAIGTGKTNTIAIISQVGHTDSAAKLCDDLPLPDGSGWANNTSGAMCYYNNDILNKPIYGALYNWFAINNVLGIAYLERNGVQEVEWKIPTDADFDTLSIELGEDAIAGGKLKEVGVDHWSAPNTGADNSSGFTALGANRRTEFGVFDVLNTFGYLWTSSEFSASNAIRRVLSYDTSTFAKTNINKKNGLSVRLVRDIVIPENLGPEMIDQVLWCAVDLDPYYDYIGDNWIGTGTKLISSGEPGYTLQRINFWEVGKTYRVVVDVIWISGWFEVFDGMVYTYYISSSGVHSFDITPVALGTGLYLDSSSFYGEVLSLSIKEIL